VELFDPLAPDTEEYPAYLESRVLHENSITTNRYVGDLELGNGVYVNPDFRDEHGLYDTNDVSAMAQSLETLRDYWALLDRMSKRVKSFEPEFKLHAPKHRYKPNDDFDVGDTIMFLGEVNIDHEHVPYRDIFVAKVIHKEDYENRYWYKGRYEDFWAVCSHNPEPYRVMEHEYPQILTKRLIDNVNSEYNRISQLEDFPKVRDWIRSDEIIEHPINDQLCFFSNPIDGIDERQLKEITVLEKGLPTFAKEFRLSAKGMPGLFVIPAECHDDHHAHEVEFDALEWFEQATPEQIDALRNVDWGYEYPADEVGIFMAERVPALADMFSYIESVAKTRQSCGFECQIDGDAADDWVRKNISEIPGYTSEFILHAADEWEVEQEAREIFEDAVQKLCNTWECDDWYEKDAYEWEVRTNLGSIYFDLPKMPERLLEKVVYAIRKAKESAYDQYMSEFRESLSTMGYGPKNYQELTFALDEIPKVFPEMSIPDIDEFDEEYYLPQFESMFLYY